MRVHETCKQPTQDCIKPVYCNHSGSKSTKQKETNTKKKKKGKFWQKKSRNSHASHTSTYIASPVKYIYYR